MAQASQSSDAASWGGEGREFPLSEKEYTFLTSLVYDRSGIVLGENKMNMVYSRLVRRLRELRLKSFREYCELVAGDAGDQEMGFLINAVTTNLTKFFRENHHFEHLANQVIADIVRSKNNNRRIRIWSAGCSSGEEPHSIAITLAQALPDIDRWDAKILATDLDTNMVATGRAGVYATDALSDLPKPVVSKFFEKASADKSKVIDSVRKLISFKHLNLLGNWPMQGPFDAIFCRNVMIYFDGPTKVKLVRRYGELLKPEGWLYIGHAESLLESQTGFRPSGRTIYRKLPA
jgi:chemotaxis protein methyltransferase CheR